MLSIKFKIGFPDIKRGGGTMKLICNKALLLALRICATHCGTNSLGHNKLIISEIMNIEEVEFYCNECVKNA